MKRGKKFHHYRRDWIALRRDIDTDGICSSWNISMVVRLVLIGVSFNIIIGINIGIINHRWYFRTRILLSEIPVGASVVLRAPHRFLQGVVV